MAEHSCWARSQDGSHPEPLAFDRPMPDGVHPRLHPMQSAGPNPHFNCFLREPEPSQLPPPHHPVLPLREHGDIPIVAVSPRKPL